MLCQVSRKACQPGISFHVCFTRYNGSIEGCIAMASYFFFLNIYYNRDDLLTQLYLQPTQIRACNHWITDASLSELSDPESGFSRRIHQISILSLLSISGHFPTSSPHEPFWPSYHSGLWTLTGKPPKFVSDLLASPNTPLLHYNGGMLING